MKVDLRKKGEPRVGGSRVLTDAQQKIVNAAKKKGDKEIQIELEDEVSKPKSKPVFNTETDKKEEENTEE